MPCSTGGLGIYARLHIDSKIGTIVSSTRVKPGRPDEVSFAIEVFLAHQSTDVGGSCSTTLVSSLEVWITFISIPNFGICHFGISQTRTGDTSDKSQTNRKRSVLSRCGRFGVRRRSTLTCCSRTRFSASRVALALRREARIPRISLNRSVIRMRAYAARLLRLRRIEFSVHTGVC